MMLLFVICISINMTYKGWTNLLKDPDAKPALVFAWAPWCPHCQRLFDTWAKIANKYKNDENVQVISINCTAESKLCQDLGVRGYPSFFTHLSNTSNQVNVARTVDGISNMVESLKVKYVNTKKFLQKLSKAAFPAFTFKLRESDDASLDIATRVCEDHGLIQDERFFINFDNDHQGNCQARAYITNDYFKIYQGKFTYSELSKFVRDFSIKPFDKWSFESILQTNRLFAIPISMPAMYNYTNISKKFDSIVLFGDSTSYPQDKLKKLFKITPEMLPSMVFLNMSSGSKFYVLQKGSEKKVHDFLQNVQNGNTVTFTDFDVPNLKKAKKTNDVKRIVDIANDGVIDGEPDAIPINDSKMIVLFIGIGVLVCGAAAYGYRIYSTSQRKED
ncbi:hypothetical protein TRFO_19376 [Tritrichomonas foetus]|uniref:Thioredoxin domain-containing protein n=1 Tax=Tritrichomonas foetus TaxID=1144522 RepID=A0A1J4KJ75_9EUKA|nr:hypothetical protein TRFO_19376 [Tritrichomonas foetus]|eukprot:OHT11275.1 hypothetical protein TRFO_19376 [Tritrichomonas foetus]